MDCCTPGGDPRYDRQFDERAAAAKLLAYRRNGPPDMTRQLIDALAAGGVEGLTILEIGGGVGAIHHELLTIGAERAVDVDASRAYLAAATEEAQRQGHADRVRYLGGDFVKLADDVAPADLVALDRVICCYPDMKALVNRSSALARRRYGLVYPRDTWFARIGIALENFGHRLTGSTFRAYVHRTADVEALLAAEGFVARARGANLIWQMAVYERAAA
jgi:magnesium-protoporphyrin O-methyltransferase